MKGKLIILGIIGILLTSCTRFKSEKMFFSWLENPDNHMVKISENKFMKIKVKYLPAEYLAYNDLKSSGITPHAYDSLKDVYNKSLTFLVSFELKDKVNQAEILFNTAPTLTEFKDRINQLNFRAGEVVTLVSDGKELEPIGSTLENLYNIDNKKNLFVVFPKMPESKDVDVKIDDVVFGSGIQHFRFETSQLNNIPPLDFINTKSAS